MSLSAAEEKRIQTIETALAQHTTAIKNLASKRQLNHILTLVTTQLEEIQTQLNSLQSQIDALKK